MKIVIIILLLIFSYFSSAIGQQNNYKIIDSLINEHINAIKPELLNEKKRCFNIENNSSEIDYIIESKLLEMFPEFSFHKNRENQCPKLKINTINVSVNYNMINEDKVQRNIAVELSAIIEDKDYPLKLIHKQNLLYSDVIKLNDINNLQKSSHSFDKGEIPIEEHTFYDNYLQPIIFIGTAIVTLAILFTVRSN